MRDTIDSKKSSKRRLWLTLCVVLPGAGLVLGLIMDSVGFVQLFQRHPAIEAEVLEDGLRKYLDKKHEETD